MTYCIRPRRIRRSGRALTRSEVMSRVRARDTRPELAVRRGLHSRGLRYRVNWKSDAGRLDIAFPRLRIAVYIDGCFWHGCPTHGAKPKTNSAFWTEKIATNQARDRRQRLALIAAGWTVLTFWEHEVTEDTETVIAVIDQEARLAMSRLRRPERPEER